MALLEGVDGLKGFPGFYLLLDLIGEAERGNIMGLALVEVKGLGGG